MRRLPGFSRQDSICREPGCLTSQDGADRSPQSLLVWAYEALTAPSNEQASPVCRRKHAELWGYWQRMADNVLSHKCPTGLENVSLALILRRLLNAPTTGRGVMACLVASVHA